MSCKFKINLNKLNCMNYYVSDGVDSWYICTGVRGLWRFCKHYGYSFRQILVGLEYEGQWVGHNHNITMV